jgi:hypothetical protein
VNIPKNGLRRSTRCARGTDEADRFLFALSTQSHEETQQLPEGSAIRIPPYSRIIGASHLLNANDTAVFETPAASATSAIVTRRAT